MPRNQRIFFVKFIYFLIDLFFIILSIFLACLLRIQTIYFPLTLRDLFFDYTNPFQFIFVFWVFALLVFNNVHGLYQTHRELRESLEISQVIKSIASSSIFTIVAIYILKIEGFPRSILVLTAAFLCFFLSIWRILKRLFVEYLVSRGYNNFNVLIIGSGNVGVALAEEIKKRPGMGLKVIGFLDDFKSDLKDYAGHHVIGRVSDFQKIARKEFVNKIFITIHHDSQIFLKLLEQARELRIAVRVVPHGFEFTTGEFFKYNIGFIPVLEYCDEEHFTKQTGKRLFDCTLALLSFIAILPAFIVIAVLIRLDSPGSVFYRSRRYGRRGKIFYMYKFRSMMKNADETLAHIRDKNEVDGPIFKIKSDPRVTKLGRFLRRYSLDEIPQMLNVLKGDMSLVGPRPLPVEQIEKEDLRQLKRLEVRPGITGLWQIRGRSDLSFGRLVKWDVWYINNWSFWLDLNILFKTLPVVMHGKGAY